MNPATPERFLRLPELKRVVGLCGAQIYTLIQRGSFPKPAKIGRASAWPESEVLAWIEARKAERNAA